MTLRPNIRKTAAKLLPEQVKLRIFQGAHIVSVAQQKADKVLQVSQYDAIYHICVQRTASQWIKQVLSDKLIYQYTGLHFFDGRMFGANGETYQQRRYAKLPTSKIVAPLYLRYDNFCAIAKPSNYGAFFVTRDPRDIVVSHYFSSLKSHTLMGDMKSRREKLQTLSLEDGLIFTISYLDEYGLFDALRTWNSASEDDNPNVKVVAYEELTGENQFECFSSLFKHLGIDMPQNELDSLLRKYSFQQVSGREPGKKDVNSHYRAGKKGDWQNIFTEDVDVAFNNTTGDLIKALGYE